MPEYYGYVAPDQVNLGKSIANVAEMFIAAEDKRKAKREGEQKSLDEARKKISEIEQTSNPSINSLVNNGVDGARNYIVNLEKMRKSGKITGADFNRAMTNINESWDNFAFSTKNMNERLAENMTRAESGEASAVEMKRAQIQSDILNTKDKSIIVGEDGNMYMIDKNNPDKHISLRSLGNLDNMVHNKMDIDAIVNDAVTKFGDFTIESGTSTESGARTQGELYNATKVDIINSIVNKKNPAAVVSLLMDNMGADYDQYYNNTEKNELLDEAVARQEKISGYPMDEEQKKAFKEDYLKNKMIEYRIDENGVYQPVVTEQMIKEAENFIDRKIEMQVGRTKTEDEDRAARGGGPSTPSNEPKNSVTALEQKQLSDVRAAWDAKDVNALRKASNDQYFFAWSDEGGLDVFTVNPNPYLREKAEYKKKKAAWDKLSASKKLITKEPVKPKKEGVVAESLSGVSGLYKYFFGSSGKEKWLIELERQRSGGGGGASQTPQAGAGDAVVQGS
jgi:hypothetical protein